MGQRSLYSFFLLTFTITWGIAALLLLFPAQMAAWFGAMSASNPLFRIAVFTPTLAAILVTVSTEGFAGLRALLSQIVRWRFGFQWYLFVLLGMPALGLGAAMLGGGKPIFGLHQWYLYIPLLASRLYLDPGPLGEELGWRGYALPRLLVGRSTLSASLILGVIWFVWHLPAFLIGGTPQTGLSLPAFFLSALALSILATWSYNSTQGSVLPSILLHLTVNFALNMLGAPLVVLSGLLGLTALLVVLMTRDNQFAPPMVIRTLEQ